MTEDGCPKVSSRESVRNTDAAVTRQRKRRKWDQPAESLVAGVAVPGILPLGNKGDVVGTALPGLAIFPGMCLTNPLTASSATIPQASQPKIQDELIAREIVINDAESSIRYKLTKRQTQEEIQRCTGAIVITRGKYRPPNAPPDGEKPLYLHISAGAHIKEMAERIIVIDRAAAMVEEMMKQGSQPTPSFHLNANDGAKAIHALSTCVFLGFDPNPSLNIAARIRGPNDQYINHIMHETGATVLLRGRGSECSGSPIDEGQQPLHLFLSCNNPQSLEDARLLAENLLDTISSEFGAIRVSSHKTYNAVPPPQQLLAGIQSFDNEIQLNASLTCGSVSSVSLGPAPQLPSISGTNVTTVISQGNGSQLNSIQSPQNGIHYPQHPLTGGTSYTGYGGIYPQATPLQQVALVLRQTPLTQPTATAAISISSTETRTEVNSYPDEKWPPQKRKFQELPATLNGPARPHQSSFQGSELLKPGEAATDLTARKISAMPVPKKLIQPLTSDMPPLPTTAAAPPPQKVMPPPPRPPLPPVPKFNLETSVPKSHEKRSALCTTVSDTVPDPLIKLMEYGEEDDDNEESNQEALGKQSDRVAAAAAPKPFWAV